MPSDREIVRFVAAHAMKLVLQPPSKCFPDDDLWFDTNGRAFNSSAFRPLTSIADAFELVARIREIVPKQKQTQTYAFQLCRTGVPGEWSCSFTINDGDFSTQAMAEADDAPRAITLAAYRAMGGTE